MTLAECIRLSIDTAIAGTDVDRNPLAKQTLEAESLLDQSLHELAVEVAQNPDLRGRLTKEYSITLTNGIGALTSGINIEFLREGSVRDGDTSANNGYGNILQRVYHRNDFYNYLYPAYGYYFVGENNAIYTRQIATGDFISTLSPLTIDAPFTPTKSEINTLIDTEISDELVKILAARLRGTLDRQIEERIKQ